MRHQKLPAPLEKISKDAIQAQDQHYPIIRGVIRFVTDEHYASSFGLQWNIFQKTQLDSYTGTTISRDRLTRLVGGSLDILNGQHVLEVGCGSGRFTEIMLQADASVFALDLSSAVEANYKNCHHLSSNYIVAQGNILDLPLDADQFDIVVCVGVIQHTPNPEATMTALCHYLKPGGLLIIDHYTHGYPTTWSRRVLRSFLLNRSAGFSLRFVQLISFFLWPFHRGLWLASKMRYLNRLARPIRPYWIRFSPLVDYHDAYPQLGPKLLREWAILDMHDTVTDTYKHLRSIEEITEHLVQCGMKDIEADYAGNGVEVRAIKA